MQHRRKSSSLKKQDYYNQEEDPPAAKEDPKVVQVVKEEDPPAGRDQVDKEDPPPALKEVLLDPPAVKDLPVNQGLALKADKAVDPPAAKEDLVNLRVHLKDNHQVVNLRVHLKAGNLKDNSQAGNLKDNSQVDNHRAADLKEELLNRRAHQLWEDRAANLRVSLREDPVDKRRVVNLKANRQAPDLKVEVHQLREVSQLVNLRVVSQVDNLKANPKVAHLKVVNLRANQQAVRAHQALRVVLQGPRVANQVEVKGHHPVLLKADQRKEDKRKADHLKKVPEFDS